MKKQLVSSVIVTVMLLYFMVNTSGSKVIFIPFLISAISMIGKNVAQIMKKERVSAFFSQMFVLGFAMFFLGFFVVVGYVGIRDKNYNMLIFSLPIWLIGLNMIRNRIGKKRKKNITGGFTFGIVVSAILVLLTLGAGGCLIVLGIQRSEIGLLFAGVFFACGALAFILAALTLTGVLDKFHRDVFGLYIGVVFVGMGIGVPLLKYIELHSITETMKVFGFWIAIPIIMSVSGVVQIIKCLKKKNALRINE